MKLSLGGEGIAGRLDGWINLNIEDADIIHDIRIVPWPMESTTVEAVIASHIIEHVTKEQAASVLAECYRVMGVGAPIRIIVPDMDVFIEAIVSDQPLHIDYPYTDLNTCLGGGSGEAKLHMRHRYLYNFETLAWMLQSVGFGKIERRHYNESGYEALAGRDTVQYASFSLCVEALKL